MLQRSGTGRSPLGCALRMRKGGAPAGAGTYKETARRTLGGGGQKGRATQGGETGASGFPAEASCATVCTLDRSTLLTSPLFSLIPVDRHRIRAGGYIRPHTVSEPPPWPSLGDSIGGKSGSLCRHIASSPLAEDPNIPHGVMAGGRKPWRGEIRPKYQVSHGPSPGGSYTFLRQVPGICANFGPLGRNGR